MSCKDCNIAQNQAGVTEGYYYRWKNANIAIIGCHQHVKEMMDYLNRRFENAK